MMYQENETNLCSQQSLPHYRFETRHNKATQLELD